jgi:uncharacterized protein YndB with AHSA1/START domain
MKDLIDELHAVTREVGSDTLPAGEARVVTLSRSYPADIDDVWDAITNHERIPRWFLPISGDLRLGGRYQLEGNAGGEIRACEPPRRLQVTWNMANPTGPDDVSIVEVLLDGGDDGGDTTLTLIHTAVVPPEMWDNFGPGAVGVGWDGAVLGLAAHLAGETLPDPSELEKDPAMRAFYVASSEAWGEAYRASGVDEETAKRAAAATTEFYAPPLEEG